MTSFWEWYRLKLWGSGKPTPEATWQASRKAALMEAAEVAETRIIKIIHTCHRDGLGMGSACCEHEIIKIVNKLRQMAEEN